MSHVIDLMSRVAALLSCVVAVLSRVVIVLISVVGTEPLSVLYEKVNAEKTDGT